MSRRASEELSASGGASSDRPVGGCARLQLVEAFTHHERDRLDAARQSARRAHAALQTESGSGQPDGLKIKICHCTAARRRWMSEHLLRERSILRWMSEQSTRELIHLKMDEQISLRRWMKMDE